MSIQPPPRLNEFLCAYGLARRDEQASWIELTGGISSEIWRVDLPDRSICVKRSLSKLKVAGNWYAPTSRNTYEWRWLCFAAEHLPEAVPCPLAHDAQAGLLAMSFLPPGQFPVWKTRLLRGAVNPDFAGQVGVILARLHSASACRADLATRFDSLQNFHALRIEPYLLATASLYPSLAGRLRVLAERTTTRRLALVHGDVSPKNILVGPQGPVFLDAECAWYGDPAFDLAFCLNHLLLKALARPDCASALLRSFSQLADSYFEHARFESRPQIERRVTELLPALMLARIDGKSPVEYFVGRTLEQNSVRRVARSLIECPADSLAGIAAAWSHEIDASQYLHLSAE